ncbi:MAG: nicotinate-nucleotide adenylyltransferase [Lachnospiraceae bacterium]|nr:nicotinate-nucleotide adenylyltransferase [Lachnospiraceae bacterium]
MSRVGIMGGTFNPIHIGHLLLAECAREELQLDEVWFIPTGVSYMKAGKNDRPDESMPSAEDRLKMTELAIRENPFFRCLDIEVRRAGATYTYETLEVLKDKYPEHSFYFICGADCLYTIDRWRSPDRIFANCTLAAAVRGDALLSEMEEQKRRLERDFQANIAVLPFRNLELSSTEIRDRIRSDRSVSYMLPGAVQRYIEEKGFYKNDRAQENTESNGEDAGP